MEEKRSIQEIEYINKRLNIINGQINGIRQMVETDRSCKDVLIQIESVSKALSSLGKEMLKSHLESIVVKDIKAGKTDSLNEFLELYRMMN